MSLINDALKQARQAQQEAAPPPPPTLQFRPVEPNQCARSGSGLMWPATLVSIVLLLGIVIWQQARRDGPSQPTAVQARVVKPLVEPAKPGPAPTVTAPTPAPQSAPPPAPAPDSAPAPRPASAVAIAAIAPSASEPAAAAQAETVTVASSMADRPPAKAALPKLQAIIFSPNRPCAMISGKTLFVGENLDGLRVEAIRRESVTLVGPVQTNVLSLAN